MNAKNIAFEGQEELPFKNDECLPVEVQEDSGVYADCECDDCADIADFLDLTDAMVNQIKELQAEVVRWRQALTKYLPPEWADGLRQDIFDNLSCPFTDYAAYNLYLDRYHNGQDPLNNEEHAALMHRLKNGTDDTSITYL